MSVTWHLLFLCMVGVQGMYFRLTEGERRCFLEEVSMDTLVMGRYQSLDWYQIDPSNAVNLQDNHQPTIVQAFAIDPSGKELVRHECVDNGRFAFTSQMDGEHQICFITTTSSFQGEKRKFRFDASFEVGEHATDYTEIAKQEHLSAIEVEIRKLNDKIRNIRGEQDYQKMREVYFRDLHESVNTAVMWWTILQLAILVVSGIWQYTRLKGFFKSKKLA